MYGCLFVLNSSNPSSASDSLEYGTVKSLSSFISFLIEQGEKERIRDTTIATLNAEREEERDRHVRESFFSSFFTFRSDPYFLHSHMLSRRRILLLPLFLCMRSSSLFPSLSTTKSIGEIFMRKFRRVYKGFTGNRSKQV